MRRFPSGTTDQYIYFVAVDSTDYVTRKTGLSSFTVYRARNGAAAAAYTTPTIAEVSSTNMPGVYSLLLDEDMTIGSGNKSEEVVLHITQTSMAPVTLIYELYRPDVTDGETITVSSGAVSTVTTTTTATNVTTVNGLAAGVITAASIAADAITDAKVASDVTIASVTGAVGSVTGAVGSVTGNVGGNVTGSVGSVASGGITAASIAADAIGASELAADAVTEIAAGVWDRLTSALTTVGSAGKLLVDNLDATVSSRLATASYTSPLSSAGTRSALGLASANLDTQLAKLDTIDDFLDTEIAAIKAKTDNLPADPADASDIAARFTTLDTAVADLPTNAELATALGTADDAVLAQVALVKAKTDLIPAAPAAVGDIPGAATIADAVWDEAIAGHAVAGSTGEQLAAAGAAGDPWATALPGAYAAGTAGKIVGDNINATVSSRLASASYTAPLDAAGTRTAVGLASANLDTQIGTLATAAALTTVDNEVAVIDGLVDAIKAKTDSLTFTVAGQVDSNLQYVNDVQVNGTGAAGNEWGP